MIEFLAVIGGLCLGAAAGQAAVWLWRSDLRLVLAREAKHAPEPITDDEFTIVHRWAALNPWYSAMDEYSGALRLEAERIHVGLCQTQPSLTLEANLAHVTAEMHRRHPEIVPTRQ